MSLEYDARSGDELPISLHYTACWIRDGNPTGQLLLTT